MRFLVTGGAGFIGSNLVDKLLAGQHEVMVIDNYDPYYSREIKEQHIKQHITNPNYRLLEADIRDRQLIFDAFATYRPETVIHLAAKAGVRPSLENPSQYVDVNINGTVNILDASVKFNVAKMIFGSSSSVYGLNEKVPFAELDPILNQASPYGATKASGEAICRSYNHCFNLPVVALRFFTVYGPRQRPDLAIHKFTKQILMNEPITLFGDGSTSRDYTYVEDIVDGIIASAYYQSEKYEVFNLGNDRPTKLSELVASIESLLGKKAIINWLPEQLGDVPRTWANIEKSKSLLGYQPRIDINNGLRLFIDWFCDNNQTMGIR